MPFPRALYCAYCQCYMFCLGYGLATYHNSLQRVVVSRLNELW